MKNPAPIDDLARDKRTLWDGVVNPQAVRAIREMQAGDRVSAIAGLATVVGPGRPDPKNPKSAVADLEFLAKLDPPITLAEVKQSKLFDDWALVRQSRLSTMAVPEKFVSWMRKKHPRI